MIRRNQRTDAMISVARATDVGLDDTDGRWVTICITHGAILNSATRRLAERAMAYPDWCDKCSEIIEQVGRR